MYKLGAFEISRVIEIEPASGRIVWEFSGDPPRSLRSRRKGGCQKLPNGNVLITESEKGRAFEVTRRGETVWSFLNPDLDADHRHDLERDLRLKSEDVGELSIVRLAPKMEARHHIDELGGDPNTTLGSADAPLDDVPHPELASDLGDLDRDALVREGGAARDDEELV